MLVDGSLAGIGKRESVADVARVLGRQASVIVWRTYAQTALEEMAAHAGVPVINALTDEFHPCQLLADLLTVRERKGELGGLTAAFVGDGACNMGNSWLLAGATAGLRIRVGAPEGHQPEAQYVARAREIGAETGATAEVMTDPTAAVAGADVVVTDTWVSMGREEEAAARLAAFSDYTVTADLMRLAAPDAIVMHCLPAYRGKEIDSDVLDGPQSVVWDEAENRRHAQKAIITWLLQDTEEVPE
jgi:ornithine carbamoyltransferase